MKEYYVYEWIRLDTNEPFYVGKGKGKRWRDLNSRNKWFDRIVNKHKVVVNILHKELNEDEAYGLECYYIWYYKYIIGYNMCNINDGGEGQTLCGELNGMYDIHRYNENNPMYGKHHTEKSKKLMSDKKQGMYVGENNPNFGKNQFANKAEEEMEEIKNKIKLAWNSKTKEEKEIINKKKSESHKGKCLGKNNPNSKSIICLTTKKIFLCIKDGGEYYNIKDQGSITKCCKGKVKSCGKYEGQKLVWRFLIWNHNKMYKIKKCEKLKLD